MDDVPLNVPGLTGQGQGEKQGDLGKGFNTWIHFKHGSEIQAWVSYEEFTKHVWSSSIFLRKNVAVMDLSRPKQLVDEKRYTGRTIRRKT